MHQVFHFQWQMVNSVVLFISAMFTSTRAPPPPLRCDDNYFKCRGETGVYQCIPRHRTCDGHVDCYGAMDEDSAAAGCASE